MPFVDYLSFTWKSGKDIFQKSPASGLRQLKQFWQVFPELEAWKDSEGVVSVQQFRNYYTHQIVLDPSTEFVILYSEFNADQAVMVNVPGSAMYQIAQLLGDGCVPGRDKIPSYQVDAWPVFKKLVERGAKVTRVDISWDDYSKKFQPRELMQYWISGQISTPARYAKCVASRQQGFDTFYLGKRGSDRMLRVYDKSGESDGEIDAIRWEFEYRRERAQAIAQCIAAGPGYDMVSELLGSGERNGFLVIKEFGCRPESAGGLSPGSAEYFAAHQKKYESVIVQEWVDFVKHELQVPNIEEPVVISTKKSNRTIRGKFINLRNQMRNICEVHYVADACGLQNEMRVAWQEAFARLKAECEEPQIRASLYALERELREDPEAINLLLR